MGPQMREVITPEVMVRAITLIPVASISDQQQLQSFGIIVLDPIFDSFAAIMSKFLRSRSSAVSEKNIDKF